MKLNYSLSLENSCKELRLEFDPNKPFLTMIFKNGIFGVKLVLSVLKDFNGLDDCEQKPVIIDTEEFVEVDIFNNTMFMGIDDIVYKYYITNDENNITSSVIFSKSIIDKFIKLYNELFISGVNLITSLPDDNVINIHLMNGMVIYFRITHGDCSGENYLSIKRKYHPDLMHTDEIMDLGEFRLCDIEYDNIVESEYCSDFRKL